MAKVEEGKKSVSISTLCWGPSWSCSAVCVEGLLGVISPCIVVSALKCGSCSMAVLTSDVNHFIALGSDLQSNIFPLLA
jgi:hypothetical protein